MNTTTATTATAVPTLRVATVTHQTRSRHGDVAAVPAAIRSEWIKLRSLRSTPAVVAATVILGVGLSWILATIVKTDPYSHEPFTISHTFVVSTVLTTGLAAIAGILSFTSEVQHGTLPTALAAQPARWVIVAGKATVASIYGLVLGAVGMVAGFIGAVVGGLDVGNSSGVLATVG